MKLRKLFPAVALFAIAIFFTQSSRASDLTGASIYATLNPGTGIEVLQQFSSPATVGPGVEFTASFSLIQFQTPFYVSADFGADDLTLVFTAQLTGIGLVNSNFQSIVDLTFQNFPPMSGGFDSFDYSCNPMLGTACFASSDGYYEGSTSGGGISFDFKSIYSGDTYHFFNAPTTPTAPPVPEPSSLTLLGTGLLASVTAVRKRFGRRSA